MHPSSATRAALRQFSLKPIDQDQSAQMAKQLRIPARALVTWLMLCLTVGGSAISRAAAQPNPPPPDAGFHVATIQDQAPPAVADEAPSIWIYQLQRSIAEASLGEHEAERLCALYQGNNWEPLFIDPGFQLTPDGRYFLDRLSSLTSEGFDSGRFPRSRLNDQLKNLDTVRTANPAIVAGRPPAPRYIMQAAAATTVTDSAWSDQDEATREPLHWAAAQVDLTLLTLLARWVEDMNPFEPFEGLKSIGRFPSLADFLDSLKPRDQRYGAIEQALGRYLHLATTDPLPPIQSAGAIRPGATGRMVERIQNRLHLEGYYAGPVNGRFDPATRAALKDFQEHHLLPADGVVGERTRAWLNAPFADKAKLIAASMRTMRQSEARRQTRFLRINVPEYTLEYYKDGQLFDKRRIVVGRSSGRRVRYGSVWVGENHTPTISSSIQRVIINPRWYVPERIRLELTGRIAADPSYLSEHGFVSMQSEYSFGGARIYQAPGRHNPLGKVKFEFPNRYGVYLHDTTEKHLFQRARRDFSHGCIRVEQATDLAQMLLRDDQNPALAKVPGYLAGTSQRFIELVTPLPIVVEYAPVTVSPEGRLIFIGDPYGRLIDSHGRGFPL